MNKSESIARLAKALAAAQGEMENAAKSSVNPHFKSKYADLAELTNTVRPVLSKHGLSIVQFPSFDGTMAHVETVIAHESGEYMSGITSSPVQKNDPQGIGSATTYLRRYSLAAACNLAQEDDDANAASNGKPKGAMQAPKPQPAPQPAPEPQPAPQPAPEPMISDGQRKMLMALYGDCPREERLRDANEILQTAKPGAPRLMSFSELTGRAAAYLIDRLEKLQGRKVA